MRASTPVSAAAARRARAWRRAAAGEIVEPVHAVQVERMRVVGADLAERRPEVLADQVRLRQLGERRQPDALVLQQWRSRGCAPWHPRPSPESRTGQILVRFPISCQLARDPEVFLLSYS
jgi:hypothetical protein